MFEAKITIDAPELSAAINILAKALVSNANATTYLAEGVTKNIAPKFTKANSATVQPAITDAPTEVEQTPTAPVQEAAKATPTGAKAEKMYTLDDLSRAGAELIDQGKMPQLIDLLKKNGVQAITQLKPEQYNAVAAELNALGANL